MRPTSVARWVSEGSAAGGGRSDPSAAQLSKFARWLCPPQKISGTASRREAITRRSEVRVLLPQPDKKKQSPSGGCFFLSQRRKGGLEPFKCNSPVDCCRRRLDGGERLFSSASAEENAIESSSRNQKRKSHPNRDGFFLFYVVWSCRRPCLQGSAGRSYLSIAPLSSKSRRRNTLPLLEQLNKIAIVAKTRI